MTNNQLTDERVTSVIERLEHYACNLKWTNVRGAQDLLAAADGLRELQERRKAAMDSEPVAYTEKHEISNMHATGLYLRAWPADRARNAVEGYTIPLYRHAQPAPVVEREPIAWLNDAYLARGVVDGEAGSEDAGPGYIPVYREAVPQPAPVVPDAIPVSRDIDAGYLSGWNDCRAAMLQNGTLTNEGTSLQDNHSVDDTEKVNSPVIPDGYVMVPKEPTAEMILSAMRDNETGEVAEIYELMLAAAPQSLGSEPATVPGKWIPVSERIPDNTEPVLCIEKRADFGTYGQPFVCWHDGDGWVGKANYRPIVTHWMPLPAAPQEV
ncbi:TPA: DUF551 domain-containing protein [Klebsiella pneumoniae]|nr:DUF551 domain-containing protein [Klebsiella pneumoniae]KSY12937.1 hypothetical protein APU00_01970 [Klebsiella pneumoniae]MCS5791577.1 DUF551 domain-containing protein [Klebsiella pneumoniae subsp. pneumoniae]